MRILAVTNMYPTSHAPAGGSFVEQQVKGLKQAGLDVEVLFVDRLRDGMRVYLGLQQRLRACLDSFKPDLIHIMYGGIMADQITKNVVGLPTVVTFQGSDLLGEHTSGILREFLAAYGVIASKRAAHRASRVIVVSKSLYEALPSSVDRAKVSIIPCGIDLERFKPLDQLACCESLGWSRDRFHVLFPSHPNNTVKRVDLARAAVHALVRLGVPADLHYLQGIPNDLVPLWLNACDVLILTSLHEGSPTIIKEALACNRPVVSLDVGDVRERIQGIDGCFLALPEASDLAEKLYAVYSGRRTVAGRTTMQTLSLEATARRLNNLYSEVIGHRGLTTHKVSHAENIL